MKFTWQGKEWWIHDTLSYQLVSIAYNLKKDWDFVILITGDRKVRVGKSVLAMAICAYLAYCLSKFKIKDKVMNKNAYDIENIFFDNKVMVDEAQKRSKFSVIQYDEGREGLAAVKAMRQFQQDLIDFFNECGQLNHIFVIVCPDFFELKEDIAVGRSECLINVYRREETVERDVFYDGNKIPLTIFKRGFFEFFSRNGKALLYDIAKSTRRKSYQHVKANFLGTFPNQYPVDEEEYRKKKADSLARFKERHMEQKEDKDEQYIMKFIGHYKDKGLTGEKVKEKLGEIIGKEHSARWINQIYQKYKEKAKKEVVEDDYMNNMAKTAQNGGKVPSI